MKRVLMIFLSAILCLSFAACRKDESLAEDSTTAVSISTIKPVPSLETTLSDVTEAHEISEDIISSSVPHETDLQTETTQEPVTESISEPQLMDTPESNDNPVVTGTLTNITEEDALDLGFVNK